MSPRLEGAVPGWRGVGEILDPIAARIVPGSVRQPMPGPIEQAPSASDNALVKALLDALDRWRSNGVGLPSEPVAYSTGQVATYLLGTVNPIRIDQPLRRERRCVVITNCSRLATGAANTNVIWYGYDSTVRANNGGILDPGQSISLPINERVVLYGIGVVAAQQVSVHQFGS